MWVMDTYVIAVKRAMRDQVSPKWIEELRDIKGLVIRGSSGGSRIQIEATAEAISEVQARFAGACHIEPVIEHQMISV